MSLLPLAALAFASYGAFIAGAATFHTEGHEAQDDREGR